MDFIIQHTSLGWCLFDLLALAILVAVSVYSYVKIRKMKEYVKELEDRFTVDQTADDEQETAYISD